MEHNVRINVLSTAVVLALGVGASVVTSTVVAARAYRSRVHQIEGSQRQIVVRGSARERVASDIGAWTISVSGQGKTMAEAFEVLDGGIAKVRAFLKEQGFSETEVSLRAIETHVHHPTDDHGHELLTPDGFALSRELEVATPAVERVNRAGGEVTRLIREGVAVSSAKPRFYYSAIGDLKIRILGKAAQDARARADEIAGNSGGTVSEVRSVQMGVLQVTEPNSTDVSAEGLYNTDTIEKDVSAVVTVTYGLKG